MMWTKRAVAVTAIAGLTAAGLAGVAVASGDAGSGADDVLEGLVSEGTVTQEDAEAFARVQEEFQAGREERRAEHQAEREQHMAELAAAAGVSVDDLTERMRAGETLNDIAGDNASAVRDLLVARAQERL
ncbi:MAG: hypothetical protein WCA82_07955, partial [Jiangellales bacterium]